MSPSIRQLALKTGFSTATVSMALRGSGRMAEKTRETIRQAAEEMGYRPLPLLSKAFSIVRQPKETWYQETIAYVTEYPMESAPRYQSEIFEGAVRRARDRGYLVEPFLLSGKPLDHRRLSRILYSRGIRGLVILPRVEYAMPRLYLDWSKFAAVEIGRTLRNPRFLHRIERPIYYELNEAFHFLKRAGFRRIGMAVEPTEDSNRIGIYTAAHLLFEGRLPRSRRIPPLATAGPWTEKTFRAWMTKHRPDVLIIHTSDPVRWLERMKLRVPEDVSVFCSNVQDAFMAGMRANLTKLGESSIEMLSLLLENDEMGPSPEPRCWLVPDHWQVGQSLSRAVTFPGLHEAL